MYEKPSPSNFHLVPFNPPIRSTLGGPKKRSLKKWIRMGPLFFHSRKINGLVTGVAKNWYCIDLLACSIFLRIWSTYTKLDRFATGNISFCPRKAAVMIVIKTSPKRDFRRLKGNVKKKHKID